MRNTFAARGLRRQASRCGKEEEEEAGKGGPMRKREEQREMEKLSQKLSLKSHDSRKTQITALLPNFYYAVSLLCKKSFV